MSTHTLFDTSHRKIISDRDRFEKEKAMATSETNVLSILLAILLPPLGVFLKVGLTTQFWINLILTIFGYIPGIIHAVWLIARK